MGAEFWERPSMRHFMDPERDEKVENRAKKVENLKVASYIVPKIVQIRLKVPTKNMTVL